MRIFKFSLILLIVALLLSFAYAGKTMPVEKDNSISIEEVKATGIQEVSDSDYLTAETLYTIITNLNFEEVNNVVCGQCFDNKLLSVYPLITYAHINFDVGWQDSKNTKKIII